MFNVFLWLQFCRYKLGLIALSMLLQVIGEEEHLEYEEDDE